MRQVGSAATSTIKAVRRNTAWRKASQRLALIIMPLTPSTGTTASAPITGTSTSGISSPTP